MDFKYPKSPNIPRETVTGVFLEKEKFPTYTIIYVETDAGEQLKLIRVEKRPEKKVSICNTYLDRLLPMAKITVTGFIREPEANTLGWVNFLTVISPNEIQIEDFFIFDFRAGIGTCMNLENLKKRKMEDESCSQDVNEFYNALIGFKKKQQHPDEPIRFDYNEFLSDRKEHLGTFLKH